MDETAELKTILDTLVKDYESQMREYRTFTPGSKEEEPWLQATMARLKSEGSINLYIGGACKLTDEGYKRYGPLVRSGQNQIDAPDSLADLKVSLLYRIMRELGHLRHLNASQISTGTFDKIVDHSGGLAEQNARYWHINRHLGFLEDTGYVQIGLKLADLHFSRIRLTSSGQVFVQPELAEFGQHSILPELVKSLENHVQVLTYPEHKEGLLYNLRDALARNAPDMIVKAIVEIGMAMAKPA
jgi:hypothetical protein